MLLKTRKSLVNEIRYPLGMEDYCDTCTTICRFPSRRVAMAASVCTISMVRGCVILHQSQDSEPIQTRIPEKRAMIPPHQCVGLDYQSDRLRRQKFSHEHLEMRERALSIGTGAWKTLYVRSNLVSRQPRQNSPTGLQGIRYFPPSGSHECAAKISFV